MSKSRIEILTKDSEGEFTLPVTPNQYGHVIGGYQHFVIVLFPSHRMGYQNRSYHHCEIVNFEGVNLWLFRAENGIYIASKRYNLSIFPCQSVEEARTLRAKLQDTDFFKAPSYYETSRETAELD